MSHFYFLRKNLKPLLIKDVFMEINFNWGGRKLKEFEQK